MRRTNPDIEKLVRSIFDILDIYMDPETWDVDCGGLLGAVINIIEDERYSPSQLGTIIACGKGLNANKAYEPEGKAMLLTNYYNVRTVLDQTDSGLFMLKKLAAITAIVRSIELHEKINSKKFVTS